MAMFDSKGNKVGRNDEYRTAIGARFSNLESFMNGVVEQRARHRAELVSLREKAATGDYTQEYLDKEQARLDQALQARNQEAYQKSLELIGKLAETAQAAYDRPVDLNDPALQAALNIVNLTGGDMDLQELEKLVSQFIGVPPALKTLRSIFQKQEMDAGVNLVNERLYDPGLAQASLSDQAHQAFSQGGSLNGFGYVVNGIAKKEGLAFPSNGDSSIDPQGVLDSVWQGAGLPFE